MYIRFIKPFLDFVLAATLLVPALPLMACIAVWLAIVNKGKVFFCQQRPGLHGKPFTLIKFRTMTGQRDADGQLLPDGQRLTSVGKRLRRTSLDELPQLFNILAGQMSWIGPRPLLMEYLPLYNTEQAKRHGVKPGLTGWAQVNGRNAIGWSQRFALDVYYVEHVSFGLDCKIVALTLVQVLTARGINSPNADTMEKFKGNASR